VTIRGFCRRAASAVVSDDVIFLRVTLLRSIPLSPIVKFHALQQLICGNAAPLEGITVDAERLAT
jgi:hypothetical protein